MGARPAVPQALVNEGTDFKGGAFHEPVLVKEVQQYLAPAPGKVIIDGNLGHGGHALALIEQLRDAGLYIGLDVDPQAVEVARRRILAAGHDPSLFRLIVANHADLASLPEIADLPEVDGILLDLGPSTPQLTEGRLGLSWESEDALDMRLDPRSAHPSAAEIVNEWSEEALARLFYEHAEEKWSRRIAKRIVEARGQREIRTGRELGRLVGEAIPRKAWPPKIHPATRVFLALRIEANQEFENLDRVLPAAFERLRPGGRLVVISFHGGEDGRVKRFMQSLARTETTAPWPLPQKGSETEPRLKILTPKPVGPTEEEMEKNPRSRSARLRAAEKLKAKLIGKTADNLE